MNLFATERTVRANPSSSPVAKASDVRMMRRQIFATLRPLSEPPVSQTDKVLAIIHRAGKGTSRRGIYNLEELLEIGAGRGARGELLVFEDMTLNQQVAAMQRVTVLVGVTGTGLWNALWMRDGAAGIQLFPFGVVFKGGVEFQSAIRHGPGTYIAWSADRIFDSSKRVPGGPSCAAPRGCTVDELLHPLSPIPAQALLAPDQFWEQDWGWAWMFYYGQDLIHVDPAQFHSLLDATGVL